MTARRPLFVDSTGTLRELTDADTLLGMLREKGGDVTYQGGSDYQGIFTVVDDGSASSGWPNRWGWQFQPAGDVAHLTGYFNEYGELRVIPGKDNTVPLRLFTKTNNADPAHTANMFEIQDSRANRVNLFSIDSKGKVTAPNVRQSVPFGTTDALTTRTGIARWYNDTGVDLTIAAVRAQVLTVGPTGAEIVADVNRNDVSVYATQANRPTIPAGSAAGTTVTAALPDTTTIADGQYLTVDIDQVGSTTAGTGLIVTVVLA